VSVCTGFANSVEGALGRKSCPVLLERAADAWPCLFWEGEVVFAESWGENGWDSSELLQCCGRPH